MKVSLWTSAAGLALIGALPGVLQAQDANCKINDSSPFQVNGAKQYVLQAASSRYPDQVPKLLQNAVRVLTENPEKINNEAGRQYLLLRAYAQWLQRDNAAYVMKRGDLGFTTNPQGTHNLLLAVDSAATTVTGLMPLCKGLVSQYRDKFFGEILNKSVEALNADKNDSAAYFAHTALQVASNDPRPWNVLSAVYQKQNKLDSAMIAMEMVISKSGSDSIYKRVKQQSRYNLAVMTLQNAEATEGEARSKGITKARGLLEEYLKESPGEANATQALGRALRLSGDTAAVSAILGDMLTAPEKFTETQLFEAASNAAASRQDAEAVKLFEAGLKKNPYHRVALLNFSNVLFSMRDTERMGPAVQRLVQLDPNYGNAWRLMGGYWQLRARAETDAAKKKMYNDSTLFYLDKESKTNPRIDVTLAAKSGNTYQVQGTVTNDGQAAGSWTIKMELLDETGAVVATKDVAVGPVDAGASTTFSVSVDAPKAVGYRYAPVK